MKRLLVVVLALGLAACSAPPEHPTPSRSATPSARGAPSAPSQAPATISNTRAVCAHVVRIVRDNSQKALDALEPALHSDDPTTIANARAKAAGYYRDAARQLRLQVTAASSTTLRRQIQAAVTYFDVAARGTPPTSDVALVALVRTCSGS